MNPQDVFEIIHLAKLGSPDPVVRITTYGWFDTAFVRIVDTIRLDAGGEAHIERNVVLKGRMPLFEARCTIT